MQTSGSDPAPATASKGNAVRIASWEFSYSQLTETLQVALSEVRAELP